MLEVIRAGLKLVVSEPLPRECGISTSQSALAQAVQGFFLSAIAQQPTQKWWDSWQGQFPTDVQNLLNQLKSVSLPQKESKRMRLDRGPGEAKANGTERVVGLLRQFSEMEVVLYLKSLEGKEERERRWRR